MTAPQEARTEPQQPPQTPEGPELKLDLENYQALYGRLYLSSTNSEKARSFIDPSKQIDRRETEDNVDFAGYNQVVSGLSMSERTKTWEGKSFEKAYAQWSGSLLSSIHLSNSPQRQDVIKHFIGKEYSTVTDIDIRSLYDTYCRDGSNVDAFIEKAMENLGSMEDIEWLAKKLFGKNSGIITRRILELESNLNSNEDKTIQSIFYKDGAINFDRINNPTNEEKEILESLFQSISKPQGQSPTRLTQTPTENPWTPPNIDEGMRLFDRKTGTEYSISFIETFYDPYVEETIDREKVIHLINSDGIQGSLYESQLFESLKNGDMTLSEKPKNKKPEPTGTPETAEDAQATIDHEHTLLRSRMIVQDKSGKKYSVKKTAPGKPSPGAKNLDDLYHLVRISDEEEMTPMRKGDLIASLQGDDPEYIRDPLERKKIKSKIEGDDGIYILQTQHDRDEGETIQLRVKLKQENGSWEEAIIHSFPRSQFDAVFSDQYEIVDDKTPTQLPDSGQRDEVLPGGFMASETQSPSVIADQDQVSQDEDPILPKAGSTS